MIKITIKDVDGKEKAECIRDFCLYAIVLVFGVLSGLNFIAFVEWAYSVLMFRASIGFIVLIILFYYIHKICNEAIDDYCSNKFRKV